MMTFEISETVGDKARRLEQAGAVTFPEVLYVAEVRGDSGTRHRVTATANTIQCSCPGWHPKRLCSHAAAAALAWAAEKETA